MKYRAELELLKRFLGQYRLDTHIITDDNMSFADIDHGIRHFLNLEDDYADEMKNILKKVQPNVIYQISDDFFCNYGIFQLPDMSQPTYILMGPYTEEHITKQNILHTIDVYKVPPTLTERIMQYFGNVTYIADPSPIHAMLCAFADTIWGGAENYRFEKVSFSMLQNFSGVIPNYLIDNISEQQDVSFKMELLEKRYASENRFIKMISQGNYQKAEASLSTSTLYDIEQRQTDPIRNFRNYSIIMNTLLRKGAELGSVHPIHIDKLSATFARKIEEVRSSEQGVKLMKEMVRKYCLLVKNYSLKDYSLLVQKVITRIDADIAADQTLNTHAELLNVSSSYLSTLFKKETGSTLTDYVNRKRAEYGVFLLNTTNMQIQTIAEHCGIGDLNYFTRIFKKYIGVTPKEYRKSLHS